MIVPAFNVESYIGGLLDEVLFYIPPKQLVVINDGSTDLTGEIIAQYDVNVLKHPANRGKGAALKTGFSYCESIQAPFVLSIDGDLQHDPKFIPEFMIHQTQYLYDIIIGSRLHNLKTMPWDRRFSNITTSFLLSLLTSQKIQDSQSGYRLIKYPFYCYLDKFGDRYEFEAECILYWCSQGCQIGSVPISTRYNGEPSSIHRFRDTKRFIRSIIKYYFK